MMRFDNIQTVSYITSVRMYINLTGGMSELEFQQFMNNRIT